MSLFDALGAMTSGSGATGMTGMMEHLAENGLAEHVAAWSNGQNLPISSDQLRAALSNDQVQQMASAAGQPAEDFLQQLSAHLSNNGASAAADAGQDNS